MEVIDDVLAEQLVSDFVLPRYRAITRRHLEMLPQLSQLTADDRIIMKAIAAVLPFRTNSYVMDELIDWNTIPDDPIYQLVFPQRGMLAPNDLACMVELMQRDASPHEIEYAAHKIRMRLNPHPGGQLDLNVPTFRGKPLPGLQHKYSDTVLFFPRNGQTCHAYCNFCFRWAQFVGEPDLKIALNEAGLLHTYLSEHPEVTDLLITGGDPLIMKTKHLEHYIEPLLSLPSLQTIRIGTKALAYWPYRFTTEEDADALLQLFKRVSDTGKQLAIMAHFTHPRELSTREVHVAVSRAQEAGAVIKCQAPLARHINDSGEIWAELWRTQVRMGLLPYYFFVERDTGPKNYFEVPLAQAYDIFRDAYERVADLNLNVYGPVMSATPGKVMIDRIDEIRGEKVFVLRFVRARNPAWINRPFFACFDPSATWLSDLVPAFGKQRFFFEDEMQVITQQHCH